MNASNRPKKLCSWTNEQMCRAIEAVKRGEFGVNGSAIEYGVPKSMLKDRIAGRVKHGTKPGPAAYLNRSEEEELSI